MSSQTQQPFPISLKLFLRVCLLLVLFFFNQVIQFLESVFFFSIGILIYEAHVTMHRCKNNYEKVKAKVMMHFHIVCLHLFS